MATSTIAPSVGYARPIVPWNGLTVTDLFCGAGGSSSGLVEAGYRVVIAANHWALAIESHQINHPDTDHSQADISQVNPAYFPKTHVLWGSPECTNHSIAKGVKRQRQQDQALFELDGTRPLPDEAANRSRATMWDIPRFAEHHRYMAIILENVVDAYRWDQFDAWQLAMRSLGYRLQFVWLNSMHAQIGGLPAPQSRDRMYIVMWREDLVSKDRKGPDVGKWTRPVAVCPEHGEVQAVQAFKKAEQWGRYRAQYLYRCPQCWTVIEPGWLAAESIIDWSLPAPRIGDRAKPLAEKTRERIRRGIERHWAPIIAKAAGNTYDGVTTGSGYLRVSEMGAPLPAQMGTAEHGLFARDGEGRPARTSLGPSPSRANCRRSWQAAPTRRCSSRSRAVRARARHPSPTRCARSRLATRPGCSSRPTRRASRAPRPTRWAPSRPQTARASSCRSGTTASRSRRRTRSTR